MFNFIQIYTALLIRHRLKNHSSFEDNSESMYTHTHIHFLGNSVLNCLGINYSKEKFFLN